MTESLTTYARSAKFRGHNAISRQIWWFLIRISKKSSWFLPYVKISWNNKGSKLVQETWKNKPWKSVHLAVKNRWLAMKNVKFTLWFFDHFLASFGSFFMFCSDVDLPSLNFTIFHTCLNPLNFTMNFHSAFRDFIASEPIPLVFSCLIAVNVWNPLAWTCACPWGRGVPVVMSRSWKLCS